MLDESRNAQLSSPANVVAYRAGGHFERLHPNSAVLVAWEKLFDRHGIAVSSETVRKLMIEAGIWRTRAQRTPKVQQPRLRRPCFGELRQLRCALILIEQQPKAA